MNSQIYQKNEIVFVKIYNNPWWPSIINKIIKVDLFEIIFFGERSRAKLKTKNIKKWDQNLEIKQRKLEKLKDAFEDFDDFKNIASIEDIILENDEYGNEVLKKIKSNENINTETWIKNYINDKDELLNKKIKKKQLSQKNYFIKSNKLDVDNELKSNTLDFWKKLFNIYTSYWNLSKNKSIIYINSSQLKDFKKELYSFKIHNDEILNILKDYNIFKLFNSFNAIEKINYDDKILLKNYQKYLENLVNDYLFKNNKTLKKEQFNKFKILNNEYSSKQEIIFDIYDFLKEKKLSKYNIASIINIVKKYYNQKLYNSHIIKEILNTISNEILDLKDEDLMNI